MTELVASLQPVDQSLLVFPAAPSAQQFPTAPFASALFHLLFQHFFAVGLQFCHFASHVFDFPHEFPHCFVVFVPLTAGALISFGFDRSPLFSTAVPEFDVSQHFLQPRNFPKHFQSDFAANVHVAVTVFEFVDDFLQNIGPFIVGFPEVPHRLSFEGAVGFGRVGDAGMHAMEGRSVESLFEVSAAFDATVALSFDFVLRMAFDFSSVGCGSVLGSSVGFEVVV